MVKLKQKHHKHIHRFLQHVQHAHHTLLHLGELIFVGGIGLGSLLFASYTTSYEYLHRDSTQAINSYLAKAITQQKVSSSDTKVISVWEMDGIVDNTFSPGYCTYGAARISPEFFPFTEENKQQRTRGGNAIDRCENASKAGYAVNTNPQEGSLIVFKKGGVYSSFGHVGKIMYVNKKTDSLIIRDMNRLGLYTMTDRRDTISNENIKCYIHNSHVSVNTGTILSQIDTGTVTVVDKPVIIPPTTPIVPTTPIIPTVPTTPVQEKTGQITTPVVPTTPTLPSNPVQEKPSNLETEYQGAFTLPTVVATNTHGSATTSSNEITLKTDGLEDISKHFFSQYRVTASLENTTLSFSFIHKDTEEKYSGILPFTIKVISPDGSLIPEYSTLQLVQNGEITLPLTQKSTSKKLIILIDDIVIGRY